jgi:hypothetical protein
MLLSFRDRTPSPLIDRPSSSSHRVYHLRLQYSSLQVVMVKRGHLEGIFEMLLLSIRGIKRDWYVCIVVVIDLVLIDQQSVGKRSLHLMDTINAKKRWTNIYSRVNKFLKKSHIVTRLAKERASFLKINDIIVFSFFGTPDCHHCCSMRC